MKAKRYGQLKYLKSVEEWLAQLHALTPEDFGTDSGRQRVRTALSNLHRTMQHKELELRSVLRWTYEPFGREDLVRLRGEAQSLAEAVGWLREHLSELSIPFALRLVRKIVKDGSVFLLEDEEFTEEYLAAKQAVVL